ncbi:putative sulfate/molybdate transporter [Bosea sp. (in: a-proteobacteria)]|jgi:MFS superfamily sulfate permease-like transporter|uniref:putative sulfate/molybdate transporter n=1 Tax=Bosea sp. (in: a-proteobacteria) TaxID=1871050 RepID=UPI00356A85BE
MAEANGERFILGVRELNGALGDLGTLLPLMLGTIAVVGLAPGPVVVGFALFYIASAVHYRLPMPVQPMKAVAAVLLTAQISPQTLAASGVLIGATLLLLGVSGWINRIARMMPQSIMAGLQLGLGLALARVSIDLMASAPLIGLATAAVLGALYFCPRCPSVPLALVVAVILGALLGHPGPPVVAQPAPGWSFALPQMADMQQAFTVFVLPQLSLTLTNAVLLTALIAGDYFGERAAHVTPVRLSITSGLANLLLTPFGALPMCHGAGGLAAHHRFGARSGTATLALGLGLVMVAVLPNGVGMTALAAVPVAGLGALLLMTSAELSLSRRLFGCKLSCWPVIAITAAVTLWLDPFFGLAAGVSAEVVRLAALRLFRSAAKT